jgi:hypothetical protein
VAKLVISRLTILCGLTAAGLSGQDLSGRWQFREGGNAAGLVIQHDANSNRFKGSLSLLGLTLPVEGKAALGSLIVERLANEPIPNGESIQGRLEGSTLIVSLREMGKAPMTMRMTRGNQQVASPRDTGTARGPGNFVGQWEMANDDKTNIETLELSQSGDVISGTLRTIERGYFSGKLTLKQVLHLRGAFKGDTVELRAWNSNGSEAQSVPGLAKMRGEFLVLRIGSGESVYARPGSSLVESAANSTEAAALARAVSGKVFQRTSQGGGRDGAFVGGRLRLAICSNGRLEYDESDLATTGNAPGGTVDFGKTITRRGEWSIVLRGGKPVLRADWQGTGTSYSLTAYFDIVLAPDGRSALIDGARVPLAGGC